MNSFNIKILFIAFMCITLYTSCSTTYFYSTMSTNDPYTYKNDRGIFVQEGDSLDVSYNFFGENAPITIGITNKMSVAIYVDWRKSGVIIDSIISPFAGTVQIQNENDNVNFSQYMNNPLGISYIRPHSRYEKQVMELANFNFDKIPRDNFTEGYTEADSKGRNRQANMIGYNESNSPLFMQTYLTIYKEPSGNAHDPLVYESDFYISELIRGGKRTGLQSFKDKQGDIFFVRYEKGKIFQNIGKSSQKAAGITATALGSIAAWAIEGAVRNKDQ